MKPTLSFRHYALHDLIARLRQSGPTPAAWKELLDALDEASRQIESDLETLAGEVDRPARTR